MGGKKKKSLATKLAKMSDEERARYLQHRAEMEEEARRRKEQLIATFMKKKIKKEEVFSRLNMAKINQNWHQIMRKIKIKEMKEEVEHLRRWIERGLEYKNRRISKLMDELEEAEEQYLNNFNSHSTHLDNTIESQNYYIEKLQSQYQEELDELNCQTRQEEKSIRNHGNAEIAYLKTVIYGQQTYDGKELKNSWEYYSRKLYEVEYNNNVKLRELRKTRGDTEGILWRQILQVVRLYVQRTDATRSHLQELRRIDAESADEIRRNEERIIREEETVKILNSNYEDLLKLKTDKIKSLEAEEKLLKVEFLKIRKTLKIDLTLDEKQLRFVTATSNETLDHLNQLLTKGKHLLALSDTCQKFETERESVVKWLPIVDFVDVSEISMSEKDEVLSEDMIKGDGLTDDEKLIRKALEKGLSRSKLKDDVTSPARIEKLRPKTSRFSRSATLATEPDATDVLSTPESKFIPIEDVKIETRKLEDQDEIATSPTSSEKSTDIKKGFLDQCYESLEKMETFWMVYNKTEIDVMELKREKATLEKENKQLRGLIRAVLESAALAKSIPDSRVSTRVQSKRRSAYSAPLQRIVFN